MNNVLKVEGHDGLVRDVSTFAIINTNDTEYAAHISRKKLLDVRKTQAAKQQEEINNLKDDILEMKNMLAELLSKGK